MHLNIRYYRLITLFGVEFAELEDTGEILPRADFEQLKSDNKSIDFLMR